MNAETIISIADKYVGVLEKPGNAGFWNADFEKRMRKAGFYASAPWCAFFAKMVWLEAYRKDAGYALLLDDVLTGGALDSLARAKRHGLPTGVVPVPGAIAVWKRGKGPAGHAGIVVSVDGNAMETIEGNANADGSPEGDRVARKLRTVRREFREKGLNVAGYILPR